MTETSSWTERDLLVLFCGCAIREGHTQRAALGLWREDGGRVSDKLFRQIWNEERDRLSRYVAAAERHRRNVDQHYRYVRMK